MIYLRGFLKFSILVSKSEKVTYFYTILLMLDPCHYRNGKFKRPELLVWLWVALTRTALHCNEVGNLIVLPHSRKWLSQPLTESYSRTYTYGVSWGPTVTRFPLTWFPLMLHCNEVGNLIVLSHSRKWLSQPLTEGYGRTYTYGVPQLYDFH